MKNTDKFFDLWIVIPVFNRSEEIHTLVNDFFSQTYQRFKIVIVDHGIHPLDFSDIKDSRLNIIRRSSDLWWTGAINEGVRVILPQVKYGDYILIINDDVRIESSYLQKLVKIATDYPDAIIGSACRYIGDSKDMYKGVILDRIKAKFHPAVEKIDESTNTKIYECDSLSGRGMLIPASVFNLIGLFNEVRLPHYAADNEFSWRARTRGYRLICSTDCIVHTKEAEEHRFQLKDSFLSFLTDKKKPGNIPAVINFAFLCFNRYYAVYYIVVRFFRLLLSFGKRLINRKPSIYD